MKFPITPALLAYCGTASPVSLAPVLDAAAFRYGVTTPARIQCWLANVLNESGLLTRVAEDMTYDDTARLRAVFPSHFRTAQSAQPYLRNPVKLGNLVYARIGGYDFRGRGFAQLTGRSNYAAYATACGRTLSALGAWMETPEGAADSAGWFFASRDCAALADRGDLLGVRQAWAGSTRGLPIGWANVERLHALVAAGMGTRSVAPATGQPSQDDTAELNAAELAGTLIEPEGA